MHLAVPFGNTRKIYPDGDFGAGLVVFNQLSADDWTRVIAHGVQKCSQAIRALVGARQIEIADCSVRHLAALRGHAGDSMLARAAKFHWAPRFTYCAGGHLLGVTRGIQHVTANAQLCEYQIAGR